MDKFNTENDTHDANESQDLIRLFNTVIISSKVDAHSESSEKLAKILQTDEFKKIISMIDQDSKENGISFKESAEKYVSVFREMDDLWGKYVYSLGVSSLKSSK